MKNFKTATVSSLVFINIYMSKEVKCLFKTFQMRKTTCQTCLPALVLVLWFDIHTEYISWTKCLKEKQVMKYIESPLL